MKLFLGIFFRLKCFGIENIPKSGAAIILANHTSYLDPPVICASVPRYAHFMAKSELFNIPILGPYLKISGVFPVRRGSADRVAIKRAIDYLSNGEVIAVYPEGRRVGPGEVAEGELGAALIAYKSKATVIPAAIIGTQPWWKMYCNFLPWFSQISIHFGKPVELVLPDEQSEHLKHKEILQENTRRIMESIQALKILKRD